MGVEYFDCWADHVDHAMAECREWCLTMKDMGYTGMSDAPQHLLWETLGQPQKIVMLSMCTHTHTHKTGGLPIHPATAIFPKNQ